MSKHDVHLICEVRVKRVGVEADSRGAAVIKSKEMFHDLGELFDTDNFKQLPPDVECIEFNGEFVYFVVDDAREPGSEENYRGSTFHTESGDIELHPEPTPLSAREFKSRIDDDGNVRLAVSIPLYELLNCDGVGDLNDIVDDMLYGAGVGGSLTDIVYRPLRVEAGEVVIEVSASASELDLDDEADDTDA